MQPSQPSSRLPVSSLPRSLVTCGGTFDITTSRPRCQVLPAFFALTSGISVCRPGTSPQPQTTPAKIRSPTLQPQGKRLLLTASHPNSFVQAQEPTLLHAAFIVKFGFVAFLFVSRALWFPVSEVSVLRRTQEKRA